MQVKLALMAKIVPFLNRSRYSHNLVELCAMISMILVGSSAMAFADNKSTFYQADNLELGLPVKTDSAHLRFQVYGFHTGLSINEDLKASRRRYDGYGIGLHQGEINFRNDRYSELFFRGAYDRLRSRNGSLQQQAFGQLQFNCLWRISENKKGLWFFGAHINASGNYRIYEKLSNNNEQWDVLGNLGAGLKYILPERKMGFLHRWQFTSQFNLSLFGYLNRPHYSLASYAPEHHWGVPGQLNRLEYSISALIPAGKDIENMYRIQYRWEMLHHRQNEAQQLVLARHSLSFCFLFLNKKSKQ